MSITHLLDFQHTRLSPSRPITSYAKVRDAIASVRRNHQWQVTGRVLLKRFLDLGCGENVHPAFVNLDWAWKPGIDLVWDLARPIPLPAFSLQGIFTEHCLEHLPITVTQAVLREAARLLQVGGTLRVVVPSLDAYLTAQPPFAASDAIDGLYTPALSLNRIMHAHGHQFIYDYPTMKLLMERAGLADVSQCRYGVGRDPQLAARDTPGRAIESLYVEGVKH